jgi:hypothetical protein
LQIRERLSPTYDCGKIYKAKCHKKVLGIAKQLERMENKMRRIAHDKKRKKHSFLNS